MTRIESFTNPPHVPTQEDLDRVISRFEGPAGDEIVVLKTANGFEAVLAGSVFDPSGPNYTGK